MEALRRYLDTPLTEETDLPTVYKRKVTLWVKIVRLWNEYFTATYTREELGKETTLMECGEGCFRKFIVDGSSYKYEEGKDGVITESIRTSGNPKAH